MESKQISKYSIIINVIFLGVIFIMLNLYFKEKDSRIEQETLVEASASSLLVWKNKNGENLAKIQVLETKNEKTFLAFETQNQTIKELQELVKENQKLFKDSKGVAGIIKSETTIDTTTATTVTETDQEHPIYSSNIENEWYSVKVKSSFDYTNISLKTYHNLSLVMGSESQGFFKKDKTFATVKDSNPYSNITDMRVYNVTENTKNFVVGPYGGYGVVKVDSDIKIGWQIGIGITYKFFEF